MPRPFAIRLALVPAALVLAGCSGQGATPSPTVPAEATVSVFPDDPTAPYAITAIDYHFHDAHPTRVLTADRTVRFTNQGTVRHNVTFPEFGYSHDLPVGEVLEIKDLGQKLGGPGTYSFFCRFHESFGMTGTVIVG